MSITVDGVTYSLPDQINQIASLPPGPFQLAIRTVKASPDKMWASLIEQQRGRLQSNSTPAPNARNGKWDEIKEVVHPFGAAHGANDSKEFGYWFNYFWVEAREAHDLNAAGQTQLCDAFFAVLESDGNKGFQPSPQFAAMDNTKKQNVLLKVMRIGFKRIQVGEAPPSLAARAVDAKTLFAVDIKDKGLLVRRLPLGFRGDNRDFSALAKSGFVTRSRSVQEKIHSDYGMDQEWHPFHLPIYRDSLFLRKGKSKDNCLHTVISVASSLEEMLPYPLLSDASLFKLANSDPASWGSSEIDYVQSHFMGLTIVREGGATGPIDKITTVKNVYVLDMSSGSAYDTAGFQQSLNVGNPFPERAVDRVLPEQIIGLLKVRKSYFYRRTSTPGVWTMFDVESLGFQFLTAETLIQSRFGALTPSQIRDVIAGGIRAANFNIRGEKEQYERAKLAASGPPKLKCSCGKEFTGTIGLNSHRKAQGCA
ncbi:MAG: hypothetical protein JNK48_09270 [Bryobacterales bacterium]|nr:hypothetical protein [Bryobacterales bacterium]